MLHSLKSFHEQNQGRASLISTIRSVSGLALNVSPAFEAATAKETLCPVSATTAHRVRQVTLGNHVPAEYWRWVWEEGFHFCPTSDCPLVYFNNAKSIYFTKNELRTRVGIKESTSPIPVCYCMNVTAERIQEEIQVKRCCDSLEDIKEYTKARTGKLCHVTNPAGKCCGKHVTAVVEKALAGLADRRLAEQAHEICCQIPEE